MASSENHQFTAPFRRLHEPFDFSSIQCVQKDDIELVWIDRNYHNDPLSLQLHVTTDKPCFFDNVIRAVEYLSNKKNSSYFFVIVSGEFCEEMTQLSEHLDKVHFLFVYCLNVAKYEYLKEKSLKVLAICDRQSDLISSIEKAKKSASIAITRQYSMRDLSKELATYIWYQLLKSLIAKLTTDNEEMAMNDFKEIIKEHYYDNKTVREKLLEIMEYYEPIHAIWLYSGSEGLSNIINMALRKQDINLLYKSRWFIRDLSNILSRLRPQLPPTMRVYHGAVLPRESFNKLQHIVRQRTFVSTFGYLSTSKNLAVAEQFSGNQASGTNESGVSVMFEIDIDDERNVIVADISAHSKFPKEEEVLFDIDSTFEVLQVNFDEVKQLYTIRMRTSTYGNELANEYLRYNQKELDRLSVELLFGHLITGMGEFEKSIEYFKGFIDRDNINPVDFRIHLGWVYALKGDYDTAKKYYYEARDLEANSESIKMAEIINKLGSLDNTFADYEGAIVKYRESLALYDANDSSGHWQIKGNLHTNIALAQMTKNLFDEAQEELVSAYDCMVKAQLPGDYPDFAQHQMYLSRLYQLRGDYDKAEQHCMDALAMRKHVLPPEHLDIGTTLHRLGSIIGEAGKDYKKALTYLHESFTICEKAVGKEHPTTILVLGGIANVYTCQDEFSMALEYQLKVLELYEKIYNNKDHEDIARVLNNIGELYRRMKEYEKAFLHLNRSLEMRIRVLGDNHSDTGTVHINLAETYRDTTDYQTAIQHAKLGMQAWKRKLLDSAIYMPEGKELLLELYTLILKNEPLDKMRPHNGVPRKRSRSS
ncbi:unnamed protein product [Rotaria socialis]|uniref:NAD(P)(+)--arginine ADP-ribosyltransferase n=1 Tax=Rotaria socialis TaxID=392032 RepID=A0A817VFK9_9BILA|nr:unnamed protein product [Rotaria socialis]